MSDPKRAALEAQIAALEAQLVVEDGATAPQPAVAAPASPAPPVATVARGAVQKVDASAPPVAVRHTPIVGARPAPMFMKGATVAAQVSRTPGVVVRARPAPATAAPPVAPAAAPAVVSSAPLAHRQRPIVRPTAAPKQLPRVMIPGRPAPAQPRTAPGSSYMRGKPRS